MLDTFEILTTSGVVLWSRSYAQVSPSIINNFITDVFIEEKGGAIAGARNDQSAAQNPPYRADQHTLKWTFVKELGIIFVAVYRSLLHLSWVDKLVDNLKTIFVDLYGDQLKKPNTTLVHCHKFDGYFDQQLRELESATATKGAPAPTFALETDEAISGNLGDEPPLPPGLKHRNAKAQDGAHDLPSTVERAHEQDVATRAQDAEEPFCPYVIRRRVFGEEKKAPKKGRKWDADGFADEEDDVQLDYSAAKSDSEIEGRSTAVDSVDSATWGVKTTKGQFVLRDLDDEVHDILASAQSKPSTTSNSGLLGSGLNTINSLFRNVVGGKTLTKEDLAKPMDGMKEHLIKKNVAPEAAVRLRDSVEKELLGVKTDSFESIDTRIKKAMEVCLTKMLTPTSSLDLLRDIELVTRPSGFSTQKARPYVMSIVGVNGVGKSTNLSKICYFLLQNKMKVLVVAGDTFRSGAVEQLKVHVRNLKELTEREGGQVEIFEKGYGGDAATVARDAVRSATSEGYDVVLIDTAGRRHNDQRLMSNLEKFAKLANPDKILMVGEALVGNDSVMQARNFNASFGQGRTLDGFIISKCDTVGDMVGTLVSIVHATNVPVLFVGVGQHYSDIRNFSVRWAVEKLLNSN
ncbi:signal recognition particle- alpha subunit- N-terminal-domain-containing protein [Apiospora sp. TS-2023a]